MSWFSCELTEAELAGARLEGAVLSRSVLDGADLSEARLRQADLSNVSPVGRRAALPARLHWRLRVTAPRLSAAAARSHAPRRR
ncbi:MAG: pentapeptide repeat-containing protein [Halorhodospira sp.]